MTFLPCDLVCYYTSLGVGTLKEPSASLVVSNRGVSELQAEFRALALVLSRR
jgi:hypothetical protein